MDASRQKKIDRFVGTPLILALAAWTRLLDALSPARRRRGRDLTGLRTIAVIKTVAIGDVVQALPTLKALRERFPDARITFITTPRVREVVEGMPYADEILYYDVFGRHSGIGGVVRFARELRARRFDAWIELEHYYRFTTLLGVYSGAPVRVGFDIDGQVRRMLFTIPVRYPTDAHEIDSFLTIATALGARVEQPGPVPIPVTDEDREITERWLESSRAGLPEDMRSAGIVLLHTTTSPVSTGRRWRAERWVEVADRIGERYGLTAVFTGAPEDVPGLEELAAHTARPSLISAGALTLRQFSVLAGMADLMVSVDTGPLHVAAAAGAPIVALFGPSDYRKWRPYGPRSTAVTAGLACSPCTTHYLGRISRKTCDDCMQAITVDRVLDAIESLPDRPPRIDGEGTGP